jgi:nucleotide-binding universal stress UspA family protein
MGTTGSTGLRGVFLGSVASGVLSKTLIPVLAVPAMAGFRPGANAVFATDFRFKVYEGSVVVLKTLLELQKTKLRLVHILDKPGEQPDPAREATMRNKLAGIPHDFHYLHDRDVPQAISNFIEAVEAGLVIAVAHHHTILHRLFFDSVTRRLAHRIKVPLLVLHDDKNE